MNDGPFSTLLLPGAEIVWTAQGQAQPRRWLLGLVLGIIGVVLLGFCVLALWLVILPAVSDLGLSTPLMFIGGGRLFFDALVVLVGAGALWKAVNVLRPRGTWLYGLSAPRAFVAAPDRRATDAPGVFEIEIGGATYSRTHDDAFNLIIPMHQGEGESDRSIYFNRLSKQDCDAALDVLKKIAGTPAP